MLSHALLLAQALGPLPATGSWGVDQSPSACVLTRTYASAAGPITLALQPLFEADEIELIVIGTSTAKKRSSTGTGVVETAPRGGRYSAFYEMSGRDAAGARIARITVDRKVYDLLDETTAISVRLPSLHQTFSIPSAGKAKAALTGCEDELLKSWHLDRRMFSSAVRPQVNAPDGWFHHDTSIQPVDERGQRHSGKVVALLELDAAGTITGCRVIRDGGAALNALVCRYAETFKFTPARDENGNGVPSLYVFPLRF